MKKMKSLLLAASLLSVTTLALAEGTPAPAGTVELRPTQKVMQARAGWLRMMNANLAAMKYGEVAKDATALASQAGSIAATMTNPLAKELTTKLSTQAKGVSEAAGKKDGAAVKMKLAEVKATCDECHAKIRDKK